MNQAVREALDYMLALQGAPYGLWTSGTVPDEAPAWATNGKAPRVDYVKARSCFCAGVSNLGRRAVGLEVPTLGNALYDGGIVAYIGSTVPDWPKEGYFHKKGVARRFEPGRDYPEGTLVLRQYRNVNDQGHVAIVLGNGKVLQSHFEDAAGRWPGVNTKYTLDGSHAATGYEWAVLPEDWLVPAPRPVRDEPAARDNGEKRPAAPAASPPRAKETVATAVAVAEKEHTKVSAKEPARDHAGKSDKVLTVAGLREVFPLLGAEDAQKYHPHLVKALREAEVNTPWRVAHFLGQIGHESGELRWWEEFADGTAYEARADLGNVVPGDGPRYKGRCPIMLTGRANYRAAGGALGLDLEGNPGLAMTAKVGFRIAAWYWTGRGLNELADRGDGGFKEITYRINGGYNGYTDRLEKYNRAKAVLGVDRRRSRKIKCNFVAVGEPDSRIAHHAAAILNKRDIRATVTVDDGVKVLGDVFADEPLGTRQMIVVGRPALDALTAETRKFALYPPDLSRTDFVSAAGKSYEQTIRRTAESLALYDDSGAAGRRLLKEMEGALDTPQDHDGTETAGILERATFPDAYREHATPRPKKGSLMVASEEPEGSYADDPYEQETPRREPSVGDPDDETRGETTGRGGRRKRESAVKNLGPARNPVIWSQLAALLTDFAVLYGLMPQGIDQAQTQELVAVVLAMVGSHAGFGAAARQSVRPLAKEREEANAESG